MSIVLLRSARTRKLAEFEAAAASDASLVLIDRRTPYLNEQGVDRDGAQNFEVDLRVGQAWAKDWQEDKPKYWAVPDKGIIIPPGATAIVEVDEQLRVPANRFGVVFPKARLAFRSGVWTETTKVDPTYSGYLKLFVHNYAKRNRVLMRGDVIASVLFLEANHAVSERRNFDAAAEAVEAKRNVGSSLEYFLWHPTVAALAGGMASGLVVLGVTRFLGEG